MKKILKLAAVAASVIAVFSCQKEVEQVTEPQAIKSFTFNVAHEGVDTKSSLNYDHTAFQWENGDIVGVYFYTTSGDGNANLQCPVVTNGTTATITVTPVAETVADADIIYGYYPYNATDYGSSAVTAIIPTEQNGESIVNAMPMYSTPIDVTVNMDAEVATNQTMYFNNLAGVLQFNVYSTEAEYRSEVVKSVKFQKEGVSGTFYVDIANATPALYGNTPSATDAVTAKVTSTKYVGESKAAVSTLVYMVVAPNNYNGAVVTVTTDKAIYTATLTSDLKVAKNQVIPFNINLANANVDRVKRTKGPQYELQLSSTVKFSDWDTDLESSAMTWQVSKVEGSNDASCGGYNTNRGQQFGTGSNTITTMTVTGVGYEDGIKALSTAIDANNNSGQKITVSATVGGVAMSPASVVVDGSGTGTELAEFYSDNLLYGTVVITYTLAPVASLYIDNVIINDKIPAGLSYSAPTASVDLGETPTLPTLSNPNSLDVTYTSSDASVATVDANGEVTVLAAGVTTISAESAATAEYKAGNASYVLTVNVNLSSIDAAKITASGGNTGTVNGFAAYKVGTSKAGGSVTVAAGYSMITFKAAGWKGEATTVSVDNGTLSPTDVTADDNVAGISSNGFTITDVNEVKYFITGINPSNSVTIALAGRGVIYDICGEEAAIPQLSVNTNSLVWAWDNTDAQEVTVTAKNADKTEGEWTYSPTSISWGTISKVGNVLTVTPNEENSSTVNDNEATITITFGTLEETVTLKQTKKVVSKEVYTVAEALTMIEALGDGETSASTYTIEGYITSIKTAWSTSYNNISYYIDDVKGGSTTLYIYRSGAAAETDGSALTVGDKVKVTGNLCKYVSGSTTTPEITKGKTTLVEAAPRYTITYDANKPAAAVGEVSGMPENASSIDGTFELSTTKPTLAGYVFKGWGATASAVAANAITSVTINGADVTVYAIWEEQGEGEETPELKYTLTPASGSNNAYASSCDITIDGITWNLTGNSQQQPWRIGGKNLTETDRSLYSKTALAYNISSIEINHGAASSVTVNSMTVTVSSDANFENIVSTLTPTFVASSTVTVNRPNGVDWSNCYYKITYNISISGNSNKFIEFKEAKFYGTTAN